MLFRVDIRCVTLLALCTTMSTSVNCSYFENADRPGHEKPLISRTSLASSSSSVNGRGNTGNPAKPSAGSSAKDGLTWLLNTKSGKIWALPNQKDPASRTRPVFHSWYSADSLYPFPNRRLTSLHAAPVLTRS